MSKWTYSFYFATARRKFGESQVDELNIVWFFQFNLSNNQLHKAITEIAIVSTWFRNLNMS